MAYQWGVERIAEFGDAWGRFGWIASFFYAVCAALRLARFNSRSATADKRYFEGLPSPSAAAVVAAFVWFSSEWREPGLAGLILTFSITASAGALMVSGFAYPSMKQVDWDRRVKFAYFIIVPVFLALIAAEPPTMLLAMFATYALSAPVLWIGRRLFRGRRDAGEAACGVTQVDAQRARYLEALGIDLWVRESPRRSRRAAGPGRRRCRAPEAPTAPAVARVEPPPAPGRLPGRSDRLGRPAGQQVLACTRCALHRGRTQAVFASGDRQARWMVIGEAPGADEDRQGEPFVGRAGQLLNAMLAAIGLPRPTVFIANMLKCRPPQNRDPRPDELAACRPFLVRQLELLQPTLILVVGRIAAQNLLGTDAPLARLRGQVQRVGGLNTPAVVTYHPAYLLRTPADKRKAWEDLKFARRVFGELSPRTTTGN